MTPSLFSTGSRSGATDDDDDSDLDNMLSTLLDSDDHKDDTQPPSGLFSPMTPADRVVFQLQTLVNEIKKNGLSRERVSQLLDLLQTAKELHPEPTDTLDFIDEWLDERLRYLKRNAVQDKSLVELSLLLVIADLYPQIFLNAGLIGQELLTKLSSPTPERSGLFGSSSPSSATVQKALLQLEKTAGEQQFKAAFDFSTVEAQTIGYFRAAAVQGKPLDIKGEAVLALAALYKRKNDYAEAMRWYSQADAFGISVVDELAELQPHLQRLARQALLDAVDAIIAGLHSARALTAIQTKLTRLYKACPSPALLIRLARCKVLSGQTDAARQLLRQVIDGPWLPNSGWGPSQTPTVVTPEQRAESRDPLDTLSLEALAAMQREFETPPAVRSTRPSAAGLSFVDVYKRCELASDSALLQAYLCLLDCAKHDHNVDEAAEIMRQFLQQVARIGTVEQAGLRLLAHDISQWQAVTLREDAQKAIARQDWEAAYKGWGRLALLPTDVLLASDWAWAAVSAWKTGAAFDQVLSFLRDVDEAALLGLADRQGLLLLSAVAERGFGPDIRRFIDAAARLLPDEQPWIAAYTETQNRLIAGSLKTVQAEILAHKFVSARQRLEQVLKVDPLNAEANLWLARLYNQTHELSRARLILNRLVKESTVKLEAIAELAQIEITVGNIKEARGLLRTLANLLPDEGDTPFDDLFDALENQLENKPFILTSLVHRPTVGLDSDTSLSENAADITWSAIFGVRLVSVWPDLPDRVDLDPIKRMLLAVGQAHEALEDVTFSWRFIGQETELAIVLLCRCNGISKPQAALRAAQAWPIIKEALPYSDELYEFDPIWTRPELNQVLNPFPLSTAFEVARREHSDQIRHNANKTGSIISVAPLEDNFGLETAIASLIRPGNPPSVFEIHFTPTRLTDQERAKFENAVISSHELVDQMSSGKASGELEGAIGLNHAARGYMKMLEQPQATRFLVHIFTALGATAEENRVNLLALPILVGTELFGSSAYQLFEAVGHDALAIASHNLAHVDALNWTRTWSIAGFRRLRFLFSLDEAILLIRPPLPRQGGIPGLRRLNVRSQALPPLLSTQGVVVGESLARTNGRRKLIRISDKDRLRHLYIVGRTGTGKSSLLQNLALQDIEAGKGVAVIDPHSELVDSILERIPPHRIKDVIVFDPSDFEYPISYNILDVQNRLQANAVIADIIATFVTMYDPNSLGIAGPRFEQTVRNSMLALYEGFKGATLNDVVRFVMSEKFRDIVLKSVNEPTVRDYWKLASSKIGSWGSSSGSSGEMIDWIVAKFGFLINDMVMRPIIGQSTNQLNMRAIMDEQKILLVDLAKGKIGGQVSQFLGLLVVSGLFNSAISRADMDPSKRLPFYIYIDEFQNITTPRITEMFSEARKFGISLTVANQHFAQLTGPVRESIIGNVGTWLSFQVGVEDSEYLSKELYPTSAKELIALPSYHMIAKILTDGVASPPFPVRTLPDSRVASALTAQQIRDSTRARYAKHILFVDDDLRKKQDSTAQ